MGIEIDPKDTTEVRYRTDALRQDPMLTETLTALAVKGVTSLSKVILEGKDDEDQVFKSGLLVPPAQTEEG